MMAYICHLMKNLIIHPEDTTTDFLSQIYAPLVNKTVVKGGIAKSELQALIESHDRILMLGHGSPYGLLNPGQFPDAGLFVIDGSMTLSLKNRSNCIFIWCFADQFLGRYGLSGLCSGMFISEASEAGYYGFNIKDGDLIDQSNERFSWIISKYLNEPIEILYQKLLHEYGLLARTNPIARFNLERLYFTRSTFNKSSNKVVA
jgi:hypothetical protein